MATLQALTESRPRIILCIAALAALTAVPDWPYRHLDDPSYWGVLGYLALFLLLLARQGSGRKLRPSSRRSLRLLLVGLPLVYVANRIRFGGTPTDLAIELAGLGIWTGLALAARRSDLVLWTGIAAHAVWDGLHFGRGGYIPDWYVTACVAVDIGTAAFVVLWLETERRATEE